MKSLFDETQLAGMKMKNRFIRSATYDGLSDERGHMTEELFRIYAHLAEGGVGTIITGLAFVTDEEQTYPGQMGISDDSFIEEYKRLTAATHRHQANIILQLACLGSQTYLRDPAKKIWGPSAVEDLSSKITPQEMTREDILFVQTAFADAALRAKQAGFDGVQIHAAHGYLLSKFLTPYYNRRRDGYGGSIEHRAGMILDTYRAIREKVGPEYPVLIKINSEDYMEQGMTFAECRYLCRELAELGIDAIEISGGSSSSRPNEGPLRKVTPEQEPYFKAYAGEIAQEIKVPVILVGGNRDFDMLTGILHQTPIEYLSLCRPLICESDLIDRWQGGDRKPAKCVSCSRCFLRYGADRCVLNRRKKSGV
ncbi:NADH:flavin oxidoreductase [Candidatus Formimonas warabiya]|uniref:Oxidoreductase n=1 Tax=Formimonas warabiya TaxID=1761012 RepID=A0A3G1KWB6_FORW1|nr:NADH:flavin oxidoreductase [Candidatus Formimonas warabiya]ATW26659.1 oxidoreductase [Candidatus Formimonas warabiya]